MIYINKPLGISPLDALKLLRLQLPDLQNATLSYAGRLDPMAEGLVLVLVDDENKSRDDYLGLEKKYEVEVVFGMETDSYDVLGKVTQRETRVSYREIENRLPIVTAKYVGAIQQAYPPFSSKSVKGHPLYWWALRDRLHEVEIPIVQREIHELKISGFAEIESSLLHKKIREKLAHVKGNFRQGDIEVSWNEFFASSSQEFFVTAKMFVHCSSGTYIRSLVHDIGREIGVGAVVLSLVRTAIGEVTRTKAISLQQHT